MAAADSGAASVTASDGTTVVAATSASSGVTLSDGSSALSLGIPGAGSTVNGAATSEGVVFTDPSTGVGTAVQTLDDGSGVRLDFVIPDSSAPHDYAVPVTIPDGGSAVVNADGSVTISDASGNPIGMFTPPIAQDANGNLLPTSFEIVGNKVVQHIDFSSDTPFPIVADHSFLWWLKHAWKVTKCVAAITWVVGTAVFAGVKLVGIVKSIKELGGIVATAKLLVGATSWDEKLTATMGAASEILGIAAIESNC